MFRHKPHLTGGRTVGIGDEMRRDSAVEPFEYPGNDLPGIVLTDNTDKYAAGAKAHDIARHVAGTTDDGFPAAPDCNHRRAAPRARPA